MYGTKAELKIAIVGAGASGTLLAVQLLMQGDENLTLYLIEKTQDLGRGIAYSTPDMAHILNVNTLGMSAFTDEPEHFWNYLQQRGKTIPTDKFGFAQRRVYGEYLQDLLEEAVLQNKPKLKIIHETVDRLAVTDGGVELHFSNGESLSADKLVLATGHEEAQSRGNGLAVRLGSAQDTPLASDAPVVVLGAGLSMVDVWISLKGMGHKGKISVISRSGLLPQRHATVVPVKFAQEDIPFNENVNVFALWLLKRIKNEIANGGDWRSVVDGLRPYNQLIWKSWSPLSRLKFMKRLRPFWNTHRHRLPAHIYDGMVEAFADSEMEHIKGSFVSVEAAGTNVRVGVKMADGQVHFSEYARLYDCGGVAVNVENSSNKVIRALLDADLARPDPINIGLDTSWDRKLIAQNGEASNVLYALGPITRGTFFEIESVPEIKVHAKALAHDLLK